METRSSCPPRASTFDFTASIPTPRPEMSVTAFAMLNPGIRTSCTASSSVMTEASSSVRIPRSTAFCLTLSGSIPAPSSDTSMMTPLPS